MGNSEKGRLVTVYKSKIFFSFFTLLLILLSTAFFSNQGWQGPNWTFPYFSGAANFERLFDWKISPSDFEQAKKLSAGDYRLYKHKRTDDLITNTVNNYGYVLVALASKIIFPFLGDVQGVVWFQMLVHVMASLFLLLFIFQTPLQRYGFLLLYVANPMIIYFTTFPFYYFWLFIPSFAFIILVMKPNWRGWCVFVAAPFLLLSLLIRPTTIFLCVFFFIVAFFFACSILEKAGCILAGSLFVAGVVFIASFSTGSPWHTIYVGIGAYKNDFGVIDLSDSRGYEYFFESSGVKISTDAINGNWNDPEIRSSYMHVLRARYFEIVKENPWPLIRNAIMNMLQVFSVGYIVDRPFLTLACTALGFMVLVFLIFTRQYIWVLAVLASAVGFAWYFPPIPAYNMAAYPLLATGGIAGLDSLWLRRKEGGVFRQVVVS